LASFASDFEGFAAYLGRLALRVGGSRARMGASTGIAQAWSQYRER
jgi:hypothetical protein